MPLPTPIGRQREVLYLPATGHVVVLGTAGSGKTTLAILRADYLANPATEHAGRTLLLTFNRSLVAYLAHLRGRGLADVFVETYHKFALGYLKSQGVATQNCICDPRPRRRLLTASLHDAASRFSDRQLFTQSLGFFEDELGWIAKQGYGSALEYQSGTRQGRLGTRVPRGDARDLVWEVREGYLARRAEKGWLYDWDDVATAVLGFLARDVDDRRYRHIVIDEGQDFSPEMIRSLTRAVPDDGSLTLFGDVAQQIYGHRVSWRSAGLHVSKVWEFRENYRNSREVARLAVAISEMPYFRGVADLVEPSSPAASGPQPVLVEFGSAEDETTEVARLASRMAEDTSVAILCRRRSDLRALIPRLTAPHIELDRSLTSWSSGRGLTLGTYHAAKGLEFDVVFLPFLSMDRLPDPQLLADVGTAEAEAQEGRLLYVGVTRARTRLVMTHSARATALLPDAEGLYRRLNR